MFEHFAQAKRIFDVEKVDPNVAEERGETGLHHAARAGFLELVKFLLEIGADVNRKGIYDQTKGWNIPYCLE